MLFLCVLKLKDLNTDSRNYRDNISEKHFISKDTPLYQFMCPEESQSEQFRFQMGTFNELAP